MVDLKHIRHALALARHRNFARAAEALHLTQPSLSRSIATLERSLGVALFDRGKKGIEPTAYGRVLLERGEALLGGAADLRREIRLLAGLEAGHVAIGAGTYPTEISVGRAVTRLLRAHPRLKLDVLSPDLDDIVRGVLTGRFDVGIIGVAASPEDSRLTMESLATHVLRMACRPGHPLTRLASITLDDVLRFPMVGPVIGGEAMRLARGHDEAGSSDRDDARFYPAIHVSSLRLAREIAAESDALCFATAATLAPEVRAGRLVCADFQVPEMRVEYGLLRLADRSLSPAAAAFVTALKEVEAELAQEPRPAGRARAAGRRSATANA